MSTENPIEEENIKSQSKSIGFLFNSKWIVKNLFFFIFLAVLGIIYIANGHAADKAIKDIGTLENDIKFLQYEYKTIKSEVMYKCEEDAVMKAVEPMGLKNNNDLPIHIK